MRDSEIRNLDDVSLAEQQVCRLDVAVDDPLVVDWRGTKSEFSGGREKSL
jgi:hypothetical protein